MEATVARRSRCLWALVISIAFSQGCMRPARAQDKCTDLAFCDQALENNDTTSFGVADVALIANAERSYSCFKGTCASCNGYGAPSAPAFEQMGLIFCFPLCSQPDLPAGDADCASRASNTSLAGKQSLCVAPLPDMPTEIRMGLYGNTFPVKGFCRRCLGRGQIFDKDRITCTCPEGFGFSGSFSSGECIPIPKSPPPSPPSPPPPPQLVVGPGPAPGPSPISAPAPSPASAVSLRHFFSHIRGALLLSLGWAVAFVLAC